LCVLKELIKVDQECAWQSGIRRPIEEYLSRWPEIAASEPICLELIRAECLTRSIFDEAPSASEIRNRFPEFADRLNLSEIVHQAESEDSAAVTDSPETLNLDPRSTPQIVDLTQVDDAASDTRVGTSLGRYEIRDRLAHGGMGIVYRAWDSQLSREVALKLPKFDPKNEPDIAERFLREAQTAARIRHRSVCPVHDFGVENGTPYLVMSLIMGRSLETMIRKGPLPPKKVAEIASKLARALDCIHEAGLMHRDVSASNVIIDNEQEPILMDFGLARGADVRDAALLCSGTPVYMAPETLSAGGQNVDLRADIYSLGVLSYQMMTGLFPQGMETKLSDENASNRIATPSVVNPAVDKRIEAICLRAMANHPAKRYQTATELADALDEYLKNPDNPRWYQRRRVVVSLLVITLMGTVGLWQTGWLKSAPETGSINDHRSTISSESVPSRISDFPTEALDGEKTRAQWEADLNLIRALIEAPPSLSNDPADPRVAELRGLLVAMLKSEIPVDLAIDAAGVLVKLPWPTVEANTSDTVFWNRIPRPDAYSVPVDPGPGADEENRSDRTQDIVLANGGCVIVRGRIEPGWMHNGFRLLFSVPRPFHIRIISLTHGFETKLIDRWPVPRPNSVETTSNSEATDEHGHRVHRDTQVFMKPNNWHRFQVVRGDNNPLDAGGDYLLVIWQRKNPSSPE
jgi:serine/threonine protein kinase